MMLLRRMSARGVLGMNRRNLAYVLEHNPRKFFPGADDKILAKEMARAHGIAVPELYHTIASSGALTRLGDCLAGLEDFVIKPASGSGGKGILVIDSVESGLFRKVSGEWLDLDSLRLHASDTLCGLHSLGGQPDRVMIEQRVLFDTIFDEVTVQGVPDIRIVVYKGVPVMAMLRLPTRMSGGRANLHQGAVGAGISMQTGETFGGVWRDRVVSRHPDTGAAIGGLVVPSWHEMLGHAARCFEMSSLGYLGVDFVLDRRFGPLMLEINARPGLAIQIANRTGLQARLCKVESSGITAAAPDARIAFAMREFC